MVLSVSFPTQYHGECDLVLLKAPKFDGYNDMEIHVRTTIRYDYSFIESAALKIGDDILEVSSWGEHSLNGVTLRSDFMVSGLGGYRVNYDHVNNKKHVFDIVLQDGENITISSFKDFVNVGIHHGDQGRFGTVTGLMGSFYGDMLARDGTDLHDNIVSLGQDWQVRPEDGFLFRAPRAPQFPAKCLLPSAKHATSRKLGQSVIDKESAKRACAGLKGSAFSFCVGDVMATGDLDMAQNLAN